MTDIYMDVTNSSIINLMVVGPEMTSQYWSALNIGTVKNTAQYLANNLERLINEIQAKTEAMVTAVLTDNASNIEAARNIIENKLPVYEVVAPPTCSTW